MTANLKKLLLATLLTGLPLISYAQTTQPTWPKRELHFEISGQPYRGSNRPSIVTHFVELEVRNDRQTWDWGTMNTTFKDTPAYKSTSEEQKDFFRSYGESSLQGGRTEKGTMKHLLYALSEQDAQKMALALVETFDNYTRTRYAFTINKIEEAKQEIESIEKKIPELEKDTKEALPKLNSIKKTVFYTDRSQAQKAVLEFDKMLELLQIEISGVQARLEAIRQARELAEAIQKAKGLAKSDMISALDKMRIEHDIELAGLLAKKKVEENFRDRAKSFAELDEKYQTSQAELTRLAHKLSELRSILTVRENFLKDRRDEWLKPVTVIDNKVIIYPAKQPETQPAKSR